MDSNFLFDAFNTKYSMKYIYIMLWNKDHCIFESIIGNILYIVFVKTYLPCIL